jgi:hypothetical protein
VQGAIGKENYLFETIESNLTRVSLESRKVRGLREINS